MQKIAKVYWKEITTHCEFSQEKSSTYFNEVFMALKYFPLIYRVADHPHYPFGPDVEF